MSSQWKPRTLTPAEQETVDAIRSQYKIDPQLRRESFAVRQLNSNYELVTYDTDLVDGTCTCPFKFQNKNAYKDCRHILLCLDWCATHPEEQAAPFHVSEETVTLSCFIDTLDPAPVKAKLPAFFADRVVIAPLRTIDYGQHPQGMIARLKVSGTVAEVAHLRSLLGVQG